MTTRSTGQLDGRSFIPLFHQLLSQLRDDILSGTYQPHDRFPSEPELCRLYGVSRATVRAALDKLVEQRLVYRLQGKGTFVSEAEPQLLLLTDPSFSREMQLRGIEGTVATLLAEERQAPAAFLAEMEGEEGTAFYVERVILGNGEPWGLAWTYYRPDYGLTPADFLAGGVMTEVLVKRAGVRVVDARYLYIEPVLIGQFEAHLLGVDAGAPGLDLVRLLIDHRGKVAVHARTLFRGDRCRALFSSRAGTAAQHRSSDAPASRRLVDSLVK